MLEKIKKIQGICHNEFDDTINTWINAGKLDLIETGVDSSKVNVDEPDDLIQQAVIAFVLSQLDVVNSEMYANSYALAKDKLRHHIDYIVEDI